MGSGLGWDTSSRKTEESNEASIEMVDMMTPRELEEFEKEMMLSLELQRQRDAVDKATAQEMCCDHIATPEYQFSDLQNDFNLYKDETTLQLQHLEKEIALLTDTIKDLTKKMSEVVHGKNYQPLPPRDLSAYIDDDLYGP